MNKSETINQHYLSHEQYKEARDFNERLRMIQDLSSQRIDLYKWIFSQLQKTPGSRILELGCGGISGKTTWSRSRPIGISPSPISRPACSKRPTTTSVIVGGTSPFN